MAAEVETSAAVTEEAAAEAMVVAAAPCAAAVTTATEGQDLTAVGILGLTCCDAVWFNPSTGHLWSAEASVATRIL